MEGCILYRAIKDGEEIEVFNIIRKAFNEFISPEYSDEGIDEFMKYIEPSNIANRLKKNHFMVVATDQNNIVGIIEVRNYSHISLYFVDKSYQGHGIGRELYEISIERCKMRNQNLEKITVNSSPYAANIYKKLGFKQVDSENTIHGIRFIPMELDLLKKDR
ncbi:GNAT family N-acetyltransferase [Anaeromicrobium sediminis]|uniref:N-acetyltransferase domain-containing protein n=1 Tax=Anaeromicrobium sediminis TaxID=1478221 RepID=A0A267MLE2_9FIRM|nr:GNAT family N-acetyltransferase [Anaeromicrobium sediminis]PAB60356.1 hypothetical protein CCE28_05525 [Anaeromicrobium sediminis]